MMAKRLLTFILVASCLAASATAQSNSKIKALQKKRGALQKEITQSEQLLVSTKKDVKTQLNNLAVLGSQIDERKKYIAAIEGDVTTMDSEIKLLQQQLSNLQGELDDKKAKYEKSMKYMNRNKAIENKLLFVLSADKISQMYRRMRYVHEYASYQRAQGEQIQEKQQQVANKKSDLLAAKGEKNSLLAAGQQERQKLEAQQQQHQSIMSDLQKKQKDLTRAVAQKRQQSAALDAQIDRLIAQEIAAAKKRAEEKARREAAARKAAEAKRRAEAEAKRRAAAKAAAENARRLAAAKEAQRKAEAAALAAKRRSAAERKAAEQRAAAARAKTAAARAKQASDAKIASEPVREAPIEYRNSADRQLSGNFENNRGRLPVPITGPYAIGGRFGAYNVEGLRNVRLENKGTNYIGRPGAKARAIFRGEVSAIFQFGGLMNVMVRHGSYISVYCNLSSTNVSKGQQVNARDILGTVANDGSGNCVLQFQLRHETTKLNPEAWIGR